MLYLWPSFWLNAHFVRDPLSLTFRMPCEQKVPVSAFVLLTSDLVYYKTFGMTMGFNTQTGTQVFPSRSLFPCWIMVGHPKAAHSLPVGRRLWATAE